MLQLPREQINGARAVAAHKMRHTYLEQHLGVGGGELQRLLKARGRFLIPPHRFQQRALKLPRGRVAWIGRTEGLGQRKRFVGVTTLRCEHGLVQLFRGAARAVARRLRCGRGVKQDRNEHDREGHCCVPLKVVGIAPWARLVAASRSWECQSIVSLATEGVRRR